MVKMLRCNKQVKGSPVIHCAFEAHAHLAFQQRLSIAVFRQAETSGDKRRQAMFRSGAGSVWTCWRTGLGDADADGELMPSDCCCQARGKTETAMAKNAAMKAGTSSSVATDGLELLDGFV